MKGKPKQTIPARAAVQPPVGRPCNGGTQIEIQPKGEPYIRYRFSTFLDEKNTAASDWATVSKTAALPGRFLVDPDWPDFRNPRSRAGQRRQGNEMMRRSTEDLTAGRRRWDSFT